MLKIKIKRFVMSPRMLALLALGFLVFLSFISPLQAQTVTQGYGSDEQLQRGMIVQLKKSDTTKVEAVKYETADQMQGVVVDANDAPVTLSGDNKKTFVANGGHFAVLVSDQNGQINAGDYVTISNLAGVGMKASDLDPVVVGRALGGFNGKDSVVSEAKIEDSTGQSKTVHLGRVDTDISVSRNPLLRAKEPNLPDALKRAAETIAGKEVNATRVYIGLIIFIIASLISTILLYSGIRSALISIGRNPLSKKSIIRGMLQVIITSLIIFITGLFGVYLLLKL
jgi:hypothetical protein